MKSILSRGFTLLELLVVIVIIGLLAAFVGPRTFGQLSKSESGTARAQIEALARALEAYRIDVGSYPSNENGLSALINPPAGAVRWNGPYLLKAVPLDPWGQAYLYRRDESGDNFNVVSLGRDGKPGGEHSDVDISYR